MFLQNIVFYLDFLGSFIEISILLANVKKGNCNSLYMSISTELDTKLKKIQDDLKSFYESASKEFSNANEVLGKKVTKLESENTELKSKYNEAQSKIDHIETQLRSTVSKLDDISHDQKKDIDALQLLDIYLVLMGEVFSAAAHVRLLFILHGEKEDYNLNDLAIASGYPGLEVRKTVHELRNSGIVTLNEDTNVVTLVQRFL